MKSQFRKKNSIGWPVCTVLYQGLGVARAAADAGGVGLYQGDGVARDVRRGVGVVGL